MRFSVRDGVTVEQVGSQWLVLGGHAGVVHELSGDAAVVMACVMAHHEIPDDLAGVASGLADAGILVDRWRVQSAPVWSRRKALGVGSVVGVAGVTTLVLPVAVAAASVPGPEPDGELVVNGSFEDGPVGEMPLGWVGQG